MISAAATTGKHAQAAANHIRNARALSLSEVEDRLHLDGGDTGVDQRQPDQPKQERRTGR